ARSRSPGSPDSLASPPASARTARAGCRVRQRSRWALLIALAAEPGVLEAELEGRQRYRALHVRLHPVALDLVAEDEERALLLEPADQVGVHLLPGRRIRGRAEGVEAPVALFRLEAGEVPGRGGVLHRVVEEVRVDADAPPRRGHVELLADELLEVLPGLERPHVERDADLLELLAQ